MQEITAAIQKATVLLQKVTPATLEAGFLRSVENELNAININGLLENLPLPASQDDENEEQKEKQQKENNHFADGLNAEIMPLKEALENVKNLRNTLNLEALDGIIKAGQNIVRPLYGYTAKL